LDPELGGREFWEINLGPKILVELIGPRIKRGGILVN